MNIIQIQDLHVQYERVKALSGVTFDIIDGEFLGIIGPNGGGKTTLVKTILGLVKPSKGSVTIKDNFVVGYVPQLTTFDRRFPITVGEVILTGHLPRKTKLFYRPSVQVMKHVTNIMEELGIESLFDRQIGQLSGGQTQKVLIARALMNHPNVLILDEPTAGVDEKSREQIYEMLRYLNKKMTIIIISHNTRQLMPYLDRVVYIDKKAHIHNEGYEVNKDMISPKTCPIDWFVQGEIIGRCGCCDHPSQSEEGTDGRQV